MISSDYISNYTSYTAVSVNPFTAPACKMSGLKDARTCLHAGSIFSGPVTSNFNAACFYGDPFIRLFEKEDKEA